MIPARLSGVDLLTLARVAKSAILVAVLGVIYLLGLGTDGPSYGMARSVMPMPAWGAVHIALGVFTAWALWRADWGRVADACAVAVGLYGLWAVWFVINAARSSGAGAAGCCVFVYLTAAHSILRRTSLQVARST